jgi:hypothetical protein
MVLWTSCWVAVRGPWSTMDMGGGRGSSGSSPHGTTWHETSSRRCEKVEWVMTVLTVCFGGRLDGGVRLAAKKKKWRRWNSVLVDQGHGEVKQSAARGVVRCCDTKGAFYGLGEAVEGRGGDRPAR